jgi:S-(hydroxymethyl)glutathione dehydrogenase / alcohol dehydrogenase
MKALAAILVELKKPLTLEEIEIPPLRFGQVLVQVHCSGICGAQVGEINGVKGPDKFLPHLLGHEGAATVLEVGEGVRRVKRDDAVVMHWRKAAGIDAPTPAYQSKLGKINSGWVTTFNQYAIVSENRVTPVPKDFDREIAALFGCAVTTAFGVINNNAQLKIGQSIIVFGAGGVGLNIVQGAAMVGAHPIIAVDLFDNRLELARRMGATHLINSKTSDAETEIRKIIGNDGVDAAVDNTGDVKVIELLYTLTNATGRTILVGVPPKESKASIYTLPLHFDRSLFGSHGGECQPDIDIPRYVRLCQSGKLHFNQIVGKRYSLTEINQAIEDMRTGAIAGRAIVAMGK